MLIHSFVLTLVIAIAIAGSVEQKSSPSTKNHDAGSSTRTKPPLKQIDTKCGYKRKAGQISPDEKSRLDKECQGSKKRKTDNILHCSVSSS